MYQPSRNYMYKWRGGEGRSNQHVFSRIEQSHDAPMRRRDLYFALDAEMVGVGDQGLESALARVSIVNWENEIVFHAYVKVDKPVTDYRRFVSGISPEHIEADSALPFLQVQRIISSIIRGKILIGHGLENDLKVIGIQHPWCDVRDTAYYKPFMREEQSRFDEGSSTLYPRKLKDLAKEKLGRDIQVAGKPHCPIEDAIASMDLYKIARYEWEASITEKVNKTIRPNNNGSMLASRSLGELRRKMHGQNYGNPQLSLSLQHTYSKHSLLQCQNDKAMLQTPPSLQYSSSSTGTASQHYSNENSNKGYSCQYLPYMFH